LAESLKKEGDQMENLKTDSNMKKCDVKEWTGFIWLRMRTSVRIL